MSTSYTTASTGQAEISAEKLIRAMREIELLPMPTEWTLVSPQGRVWVGSPMDLLNVLMPHHPLLQPPSATSRSRNEI